MVRNGAAPGFSGQGLFDCFDLDCRGNPVFSLHHHGDARTVRRRHHVGECLSTAFIQATITAKQAACARLVVARARRFPSAITTGNNAMQTRTHTLPGTRPAAGGAGRNRLTNAPKSYPPELYNRPAPSAPAPSAQRPAPSAQRPAPSAQRPAPSAQRPAPSAQRPAPSAQRPAPSAQRPAPHPLHRPGSSRPDARAGRARGLSLPLPVLALLAGMLPLFAPAPAQAQNSPALQWEFGRYYTL